MNDPRRRCRDFGGDDDDGGGIGKVVVVVVATRVGEGLPEESDDADVVNGGGLIILSRMQHETRNSLVNERRKWQCSGCSSVRTLHFSERLRDD